MEDFKVKRELDIGPSVLQQPDIYFNMLSTVKTQPGNDEPGLVEQKFVKLEHDVLEMVRPGQDWYVLIERSPAVLCEECGQTLINKSVLQLHKQSCNVAGDGRYKAAHSHTLIKSRNINSRFDTQESKQYKCSQCEYSAFHISKLVRHLWVHKEDKPFKCSQCNHSTSEKNKLIVHLRIHTGDKPFKCPQCKYSASYKSRLITHFRRKHTGDKNYKCSLCRYSSYDESKLIKHLRMHIGDKKLKCSQCEFSVSSQSMFKRHLRTK